MDCNCRFDETECADCERKYILFPKELFDTLFAERIDAAYLRGYKEGHTDACKALHKEKS